jgi:hypothetical protein
MANLKSTVASRPQDTTLSRRITSGTAHFREIPAVWSSEQGPELCCAFDVTWDGKEASANHFQGYSIQVRIGADVRLGDLALVADKKGLRLALLREGNCYADATTNETIAKVVSVVGRVSAEREYLTEDQLETRHREDFYEATRRAVSVGFAIAANWEKDTNPQFDVVTALAVLREDPAYRLAEEKLRGPDAEPLDEESDEVFARRLLDAQIFAAGRASASVPV